MFKIIGFLVLESFFKGFTIYDMPCSSREDVKNNGKIHYPPGRDRQKPGQIIFINITPLIICKFFPLNTPISFPNSNTLGNRIISQCQPRVILYTNIVEVGSPML